MGCLAGSDAPSAHVGALCQTNASAKQQSTRRSTRRPALSWASRPPPLPNPTASPLRRPPSRAPRLLLTLLPPGDRVGPRTCACRGRCWAVQGTNVRKELVAKSQELPALYVKVQRAPAHICTGTGLAAATCAPGLGSPPPHLHRDWAHPCHICAGREDAHTRTHSGRASPPKSDRLVTVPQRRQDASPSIARNGDAPALAARSDACAASRIGLAGGPTARAAL